MSFVEAQVVLPQNAVAGMKLKIQLPGSSRTYQIEVPRGVRGGQKIKVRVPAAPQTPAPPVQRHGSGVGATSPGSRWSGWFLKQQPNFPHAWQRRFGTLVPRSAGWNHSSSTSAMAGFELVYHTNESDAANGRRRGSLPVGWAIPTSVRAPPFGRICLEHAPRSDGRLALLVHAADRDYHLMMCEPITQGARFYFAYRVQCCGDLEDKVLAALTLSPAGAACDDARLVMISLGRLFQEQQRLAAMGFDKFDCAAALCRAGGDSDQALSMLVSRRGGSIGSSLELPQQHAAAAAASPYGRPRADTAPSRALPPTIFGGGNQPAAPPSLPPRSPASSSSSSSASDSKSSQTQRELEAMGFSAEDAAVAAAVHEDDVDAAMLFILSKRDSQDAAAAAATPPSLPFRRPTPPPPHLPLSPEHAPDSSSSSSSSERRKSAEWGNPRWEYEEQSPSSFGSISQWRVFGDEEQDRLNLAVACGEERVEDLTLRNGHCYTVHLEALTMLRSDASGMSDEVLSVRCVGREQRTPSLPTNGFGGARSPASSSTVVLPSGPVTVTPPDLSTLQSFPTPAAAPGPSPRSPPPSYTSQFGSTTATPTAAVPASPPVADLLGLGDFGDDATAPPQTPVLQAQASEGAQSRALFAKLLTSTGGRSPAGSMDSSVGGEAVVSVVEAQSVNDHAECAICFEDLCAEPVAVFFDSSDPATGKRVCQHIFHCECCQGLSTCPLCNREVAEFRELPDPLEKPKSWFAMVDFDSKGALTRKDVEEALKAQLPIRSSELEEHFEDLWQRWDATGSGNLSLKELFRPKDGLLDYLRIAKEGLASPPGSALDAGTASGGGGAAFPEQPATLVPSTAVASAASAQSSSLPTLPPLPSRPPPPLSADRGDAWFTHFDTDGSGFLDTSELVHAVNTCLSGSATAARFTAGEETVGVLMAACELRTPDRVDRDEFMKPGGLAEMLGASLGIS